jgi:hypothetical protein
MFMPGPLHFSRPFSRSIFDNSAVDFFEVLSQRKIVRGGLEKMRGLRRVFDRVRR